MTNTIHLFHIADYVIFGITIVVSLGIGIYYALSGGKQNTTTEYLVGNRHMSVLPVGISLMVSFQSSVMILGTPAEVYVYGFQWFIGNVGWFFANLLSVKLIVPLLHPLKITSAYEYLELRFKSRWIRTVGTILGMLYYTVYLGIILFGPAIALEALSGFPQWGSIVAIAVVSVIYTAIGGLKAVIWTDVFQAVVMFAGFLAVLIKGTIVVGSVGRTWEIADQKGRLNLFNFDMDPTVRHTFWNLFMGSFIQGFGLIFNQSSVQRISATRTERDAKRVMLFTAPALFVTLTIAGIEGIIAYAYFDSIGCDPLASKQINNPNQIIPFMVMDIFKGIHGMPGLWLASLFSASLSTLSSGLSSLSALFWEDIIKPNVKPMSEKQATVIAKCSVVFFGGISVLVAFLIALIGGTLIQITSSVLSAFAGPLTGIFLLGAFFPFANAKGGITGALAGLVFTFWIAMGQMMTAGSVKNTRLPPGPLTSCPGMNASVPEFNSVINTSEAFHTTLWTSTIATVDSAPVLEPELTGISRLYMVSYQWFGTIGILTTIVVGVIVSFLTGPVKPADSDPRYLISFYDEMFCCLPISIRKVLRCGYNFKREKKSEEEEIAENNQNFLKMNLLKEKEDIIADEAFDKNITTEEFNKSQNQEDDEELTAPIKYPNSDHIVTFSMVKRESDDFLDPLLFERDNENKMTFIDSVDTVLDVPTDEMARNRHGRNRTSETMQ
ncbi:hypothetical protein ACJMK2_018565 [Sinanodonta woodiana]|uniref:Sodium-coupled monocarboxylate transporter 1 n=1 Tax=Sinanodonta woodiana TaxID=1069815 RepID=A0ABD3UFF7_SINWO